MTRQTLIESIETLKDVTFDCVSGFSYDIYLDPINEKVYDFLNSNSIPVTAYNGIDKRILTVHSGSIAESVYEALMSVVEDLDTLIDDFGGTELDCNNTEKGIWSQDCLDYLDAIHFKLAEYPIASYWEPCDWYDNTEELRSLWKNGKTAEEIIDEVGCGNSSDGMVDRIEAINWLQRQIDMWLDDSED